MTVLVIVVVEASGTVVSCAKTEGARMTESAAIAVVKRILKEYNSQGVEIWLKDQRST